MVSAWPSHLECNSSVKAVLLFWEGELCRTPLLCAGLPLIQDGRLSFGQRRVLLVWTRLILPDTSSISLDRTSSLCPDAARSTHSMLSIGAIACSPQFSDTICQAEGSLRTARPFAAPNVCLCMRSPGGLGVSHAIRRPAVRWRSADGIHKSLSSRWAGEVRT